MSLASTLFARVPYTKRPVPTTYDKGWFETELGNIGRAVPTTKSRTATTNDTPSTTDSLVLYDASHGPIRVTLRPANQVQDLRLILKKIDAVNLVTIHGMIDGSNTTTLSTQFQSVSIQSDGHQYYLLATT